MGFCFIKYILTYREDLDQTAWMFKLILVYTVYIWYNDPFLALLIAETGKIYTSLDQCLHCSFTESLATVENKQRDI